MISDYRANRTNNTSNKNFVRDNFTVTNPERKISEEISNIKFEIHRSHVNVLTAGWVKEWHEKKKKDILKDSKSKEIRDFVTSSLESENVEPEIKLNKKEGSGIKRSLLIRYISLSAAAVIGVFILIRTLLPSSDPEKLYKSYYKPFNVISAITRGATGNSQDEYSASLEKYRLGDYQTAAAGFSSILLNDTSIIAPRFFMGITQMAMGKYSQAVSMLSGIARRSGEYRKETIWYLGLSYLKTGEKTKAVKCFDLLAQSPGFYSEPSTEILRRLK
jgi:TolA-binding protein